LFLFFAIRPNALLAAAGRILLGLCFLFVSYFVDLLTVCLPTSSAWAVASLLCVVALFFFL